MSRLWFDRQTRLDRHPATHKYNSFNTRIVIPGLSPGMILFTLASKRYQS